MSSRDPAERRLIAGIGGNTGWANTVDRTARTEPGRTAFIDSFESKVDPDGLMSEAARKKAAANARRAHFQRMALKSVQSRRAKAGGRGKAS